MKQRATSSKCFDKYQNKLFTEETFFCYSLKHLLDVTRRLFRSRLSDRYIASQSKYIRCHDTTLINFNTTFRENCERFTIGIILANAFVAKEKEHEGPEIWT